MKNPVLVGLSAANVLLAVGLAVLWVDGRGEVRNVHWVRPDPVRSDYMQMLPVLPSKESVSTESFLALLERPLFSSTRRPPPPPPPPAPPAPPDTLAGAQVLGIFRAEGASGIIAKIDGKTRRVRLNDVVSGWQLHAVHERGAVFTNAGQMRELLLVRAKVGSATSIGAPVNGLPASQMAAQNPAPNAQVELPVAPSPSVTASQVAPNEPAAEGTAPRRRPRFGP